MTRTPQCRPATWCARYPVCARCHRCVQHCICKLPARDQARHFYGKHWREIIRPAILARAENRCEWCGRPNLEFVETVTGVDYAKPEPRHWMYWRPMSTGDWRNHVGQLAAPRDWQRRRLLYVKVGVMHLNHTPGDDRPENLKAGCAWCHLLYDRHHHRETRQGNKDQRRPLIAAL